MRPECRSPRHAHALASLAWKVMFSNSARPGGGRASNIIYFKDDGRSGSQKGRMTVEAVGSAHYLRKAVRASVLYRPTRLFKCTARSLRSGPLPHYLPLQQLLGGV